MIKQSLISIFLLISSSQSLADPITPNTNWADAATLARQNHTVIMVIFESEGCGYCSRLKREILEPLSHDTEPNLPLIKEFDIYAGGKVTDFNGDLIRSRQFKERYEIFAVPTLLILDADGKLLADPIVGYNSQQEYKILLHDSLMASYDAIN
ncbi:MAG: thioredoxin fold domain-containing protein [Candidatus Thiodiazotropha sp.]